MSEINILDRLSIAASLVEAAFMARHDLGLRARREEALRTVLELAGERLEEIRDEFNSRFSAERHGDDAPLRMVGGDRT